MEYVQKALDTVYDKDLHLIKNRPLTNKKYAPEEHLSERSIVFRFSHYLLNMLENDSRFASYDLDCDYNRNGVETKKLPSFPNGTFPDVIIHKRGSNDYNLAIFEFKTYWNRDQSNDREKLREFTARDGSYHFQLGLAILIEKERSNVRISEFTNGKQVYKRPSQRGLG